MNFRIEKGQTRRIAYLSYLTYTQSWEVKAKFDNTNG